MAAAKGVIDIGHREVDSGLLASRQLGKGYVDFPALLRWLKAKRYDGYVVVEQDVLPGLGDPKESARRNREYLRSIETNFA